tara:strand:+ start:2951 stop:3154 length:204 start_codon:yes stop_codon:yes gene_type:complete
MNEHKFIRDNFSHAILNTNVTALEQYKIARKNRANEQNILNNCISDINILKDDMKEIKNLLLKMNEN